MAVGYTPYTKNTSLGVYSASFTPQISTANPSSPNPVQGQYFPNCSFISALASITWVNRNFIFNNSKSLKPDANGNYNFTFWDYGVGNNVTLPNPTIGTPVTVTVNPNVLLDGSNQYSFSNANGFYGAGSSNANEIWPALYEWAYAKFCYYETGTKLPSTNQVMTNANLANAAYYPTFSDVQNLTAVQWGGNGGIALMYLTGLYCFYLTTSTQNFLACGGVSGPIANGANMTLPPTQQSALNVVSSSTVAAASAAVAKGTAGAKFLTSLSSLYYYIKAGFCCENTAAINGLNKTMYPLVATSYASAAASPNPGAVNFSNNTIIPGHNYSILGVFDAPNGFHYIVLRTTFGSNANYQIPNFSGVAQSPNNTWPYYDAQLQMGLTPAYQPANPKAILLPTPNAANAIFGLEQGAFINYFQSVYWAKGF
jgi:hypothetical protein